MPHPRPDWLARYQFKRGNKGGPGRPPNRSITAALLAALTPEDKDKIARTLIDRALAGDLPSIREIWDRLEGKPVARQEQGDPGDFESSFEDWSEDELRATLKFINDIKDKHKRNGVPADQR